MGLCQICDKEFKDILKHFVMFHEIEDMDQLKKEINLIEIKNQKRKEFAEFIEEINEKLRNNEITNENWRGLKEKWLNEYKK